METENPYASPMASESGVALQAAEQPLTLLGALGEGTSLFWRRLPTLAAITLVVWGPIEVLVGYLEYFVLSPDDVLGAFRVSMWMESLFGIIAIGGVIHVSEAALRGEHLGWLAGLSEGLRGWPRLFATRFVCGLVLLVAAIFFILPAIYLLVRYAFSETAAIVERQAGMSALRRSMTLTRGRVLTMLGLVAATVGPMVFASGVIFVPLDLYPEFDNWLSSAALACILDLLGSWMAVVFVVAYVQCRSEENRTEARTLAAAASAEKFPEAAERIET
jgi:hypothetical protein